LVDWPNDLELVSGTTEQLEATALNHAFRSCRLMSKCCSTIMLVTHPAYRDNVVMAYAECLVGASLPPTAYRADLRDLPDELQASIPPTDAVVLTQDPDSADFAAHHELESRLFGAAVSRAPSTAGSTVGDLLAELGPVRVLDVALELAGTSRYLRSVFASGYDARMREKGLSPLCTVPAGAAKPPAHKL
jgi:hypothetical protein